MPIDSVAELRARRDAALARAIAAEERLRSLDRSIAEAERAREGDDLERLLGQRADAVGDARGAREEHGALRDRAFAGLVDALTLSPEAIVGAFSDRHPIVLLPVRIETKFARVGQGTELRVRIFPDDISVATPPSAVTNDERVAGERYWTARADARANPGDAARQTVYTGAWTTLATRFGAYRSSYIVDATRPRNPGEPPYAPPSEPPLARADGLPDRFVVVTYASGKKIHEVAGRAIPDDLVLVPDALQSDSWLDRDAKTGSMTVPPALKWLTDFDSAVGVGMAVRIPLQAPFDTAGFDRVVAIGVRSATPPQAVPALVEGLLAKHRYGDGCGIARAGMSTNNTESAKAGWQPPSGDIDQLFTIEDAPPDISVKPGMLGAPDGLRLAQLFGLSGEFARRLPNAEATDVAEALAMNHAATPGTLDDFIGEFWKTLVAPETAGAVHEWFVRWVSGRGHYPALRIGREPYGIVVTSAWDRWAYPQRDVRLAAADAAPALAALIRTHRPRWKALGDVASHAALKDVDPFERLLSIIGLLASSSTFVSRTAVSDEYVRERLKFGGANAASIQEWFAELKVSRDRSLTATGFPMPLGPVDPLIAFITFLAHTDRWRLPLVDRDPKVPLSERDPIGPFDGTRNFLHWLSQASRADLVSEKFIDGDGESVPAPQALLYVLLRHSLLSAIESGSLDTARTFGSELFEVIDRDPLIANVGPAQHALRKDYLEIDASRLGLTKTPTALADWTLTTARVGGAEFASTARVTDVHNAIGALAGVPTARLERLLTEHVDLCSYRLDAWITGLYSQRLAQLRSDPQQTGFYIGAYGWVENLRPASGRTRIPADTLPPALRPSAGQNVFEDSDNGGFVHAPSLMQAVTASVLRNAYLSHASKALPTPFAVNLSSARMRAALALTEGVRGGQPIAALLGYQIERGLHERHAGIELDQFIYALRDRFPLIAGLLTEIPPGTSAEVIEARNVVHGLDLIQFTTGKSFPWGVTGLPATGTPAARAIAEEVERARDALDAVSDLLLSESVHQAVQGNVARTKASLQAMTDPEAPPEPEVIRTPRSSNLLTFRVALALDADAVAGWSALSPRAKANAQLNHWLADHLPPPGDMQWSVRDGVTAPTMQSLAALSLEPIDVVLMSGDRLGDGSSELERHLLRRFRADNAVPDARRSIVAPVVGPIDAASTVLFDFTANAPGGRSLASVQPLLARLRRIITRARAADARDFWRNADSLRADPSDPTGSATGDVRIAAFTDLKQRIDVAATTLTTTAAAIAAALATLAPLRTTLEDDASTVSDPAWLPALDALRVALFAAEPYGIPEALPADGLTVSRVLIDSLIGQGQAVAKLIEQRLAQAATLRATGFPAPLPADEPARSHEQARRNDVLRRNYLEAARAVFGPAFTMIPLFHLHAAQSTELAQALAAPVTSDAAAEEEWLHSVARVRPRLGELTWVMAATRWIQRPISDPAIAQLPHVAAGVPWIGGKIGTALPRGEWLSLAVFGAPSLTKPVVAALMVDDWTENIPTDRETTGVSFNFNRPNAVAPHALLVAVPPVFRGNWEWEDLVGSVNEALDLAKVRAVDLDLLIDREVDKNSPQGDYFQLLPGILSEFSQSRFAHVTYAAKVANTLSAVVK